MRIVASFLLIGALAAGLVACARSDSAPRDSARTVMPPPPSSPLSKVQVGMSQQEVENLLGRPTDENEYVTGKAFIPFYFGPDRTRVGYFYRGMGRVVFAGGKGFSRNWHVERVEYDPNETGHAH
jgi:hypothetical protein